MFGVDGLRQHREHAEAHLLLTVLLVPHLKNRNRRKRPHEDGGGSSREGSAKPDSLPDVTSLRSSETSLAWAVSKVSGSRWNRLDEVPFFRAALYCSWNTHGSRAGYPGRMCVCVSPCGGYLTLQLRSLFGVQRLQSLGQNGIQRARPFFRSLFVLYLKAFH